MKIKCVSVVYGLREPARWLVSSLVTGAMVSVWLWSWFGTTDKCSEVTFVVAINLQCWRGHGNQTHSDRHWQAMGSMSCKWCAVFSLPLPHLSFPLPPSPLHPPFSSIPLLLPSPLLPSLPPSLPPFFLPSPIPSDESQVLDSLPKKMKSDLAIHVHLDTLCKISLFQV